MKLEYWVLIVQAISAVATLLLVAIGYRYTKATVDMAKVTRQMAEVAEKQRQDLIGRAEKERQEKLFLLLQRVRVEINDALQKLSRDGYRPKDWSSVFSVLDVIREIEMVVPELFQKLLPFYEDMEKKGFGRQFSKLSASQGILSNGLIWPRILRKSTI